MTAAESANVRLVWATYRLLCKNLRQVGFLQQSFIIRFDVLGIRIQDQSQPAIEQVVRCRSLVASAERCADWDEGGPPVDYGSRGD